MHSYQAEKIQFVVGTPYKSLETVIHGNGKTCPTAEFDFIFFQMQSSDVWCIIHLDWRYRTQVTHTLLLLHTQSCGRVRKLLATMMASFLMHFYGQISPFVSRGQTRFLSLWNVYERNQIVGCVALAFICWSVKICLCDTLGAVTHPSILCTRLSCAGSRVSGSASIPEFIWAGQAECALDMDQWKLSEMIIYCFFQRFLLASFVLHLTFMLLCCSTSPRHIFKWRNLCSCWFFWYLFHYINMNFLSFLQDRTSFLLRGKWWHPSCIH